MVGTPSVDSTSFFCLHFEQLTTSLKTHKRMLNDHYKASTTEKYLFVPTSTFH